MQRRTGLVIGLICSALVVGTAGSVRAQLPDWVKRINWCRTNTATGDATDCKDQYAAADLVDCVKSGKCAAVAGCVTAGGRSCLIEKATQAARNGQCDRAFQLALICQCQDQDARQTIKTAGAQDVCSFLK